MSIVNKHWNLIHYEQLGTTKYLRTVCNMKNRDLNAFTQIKQTERSESEESESCQTTGEIL